jgi:hypothetical protein
MRDVLLQLQLYYIPPFDDDVFSSFVGEVGGKRKSRKRNAMARYIAPESDGEPSANGGTMLIRRRATSPLVITGRHRPTFVKESRRKPLLLFKEDSDALNDREVLIAPR